MRLAGALLVVLAGTAAAAPVDRSAIDSPRDLMVYQHVDPSELPPSGTNTIFLNNCQPSGCLVRPGNTSSINDTWNLNGSHTLAAFNGTADEWNRVVSCVQEVFAPFNVQITTTDPGSASHFEIMVAGSSADLNQPDIGPGTLGISPFTCEAPYIPNSLVFDFANAWNARDGASSDAAIDDICATAAQEIAHSFTLDHVTLASDPLTYNGFAGIKHFHDGATQCGSDCVNGRGPFGQTCSGQNHACFCSGSQTENPVGTIKGIFGAGNPTKPTITFVRPVSGASVAPGFAVQVTVDTPYSVSKVDLTIDNNEVINTTVAPYIFNSPASLGNGTHRVTITATDSLGTEVSSFVDIVIGAPCTKPGDCSLSTDTCVGGRCVPGEGVQGGLGTTCTDGAICSSGICANGPAGMLCAEPCDVGSQQCPSSFECLAVGSGGLCYPGADSGGGCSSKHGASSGSIVLGLGFAALLLRRRR